MNPHDHFLETTFGERHRVRGRMLVVARVVAASAHVSGIEPSALMTRSQLPEARSARLVAIWIAREVGEISYPQLGRLFDRHHTTCLSACQRVGDQVFRKRGALYVLTRDTLQLLEHQQSARIAIWTQEKPRWPKSREPLSTPSAIDAVNP